MDGYPGDYKHVRFNGVGRRLSDLRKAQSPTPEPGKNEGTGPMLLPSGLDREVETPRSKSHDDQV